MTGRRSCRRASRAPGDATAGSFPVPSADRVSRWSSATSEEASAHSLRCRPDAVHLHCPLVGEDPAASGTCREGPLLTDPWPSSGGAGVSPRPEERGCGSGDEHKPAVSTSTTETLPRIATMATTADDHQQQVEVGCHLASRVAAKGIAVMGSVTKADRVSGCSLLRSSLRSSLWSELLLNRRRHEVHEDEVLRHAVQPEATMKLLRDAGR
jgi:hypothetical protein